MVKYVILLVFVILSIVYFIYRNITFLKSNELINLLLENKDKYYTTFSKSDLRARNVNTIQEYKDSIKNSSTNLNIKQKAYVISQIILVNIQLLPQCFFSNKFDYRTFLLIPWKVGFVKDNKYENGLPHTRQDTIILPITAIHSEKSSYLRKLLVHEKVHIYQRMYPIKTSNYLVDQGYSKYKLIKSSKYNIRANPDIDEYIYKNSSGQLLMAQFNNNKPKNIGSVRYSVGTTQNYEHPYEDMAINLSKNCA